MHRAFIFAVNVRGMSESPLQFSACPAMAAVLPILNPLPAREDIVEAKVEICGKGDEGGNLRQEFPVQLLHTTQFHQGKMDKFLIKKRQYEEDVCDEQNVSTIEKTTQESTVEQSVLTSKKCKGKVSTPRLYNADYIKLGFTFSGNENNPCPQCLVCGMILANESMVPNKLKRHFTSRHSHLSEKPVEYFIELSKSIKKQSASFTKRMKTSEKAQKASYLVAQIIAKNKEPHTIAETTIKESCCAIVRTMFGPEFEIEVNKIPLADNTIGRCIQDMSADIKLQMKDIFQEDNMLFTLQLDESTDVSGLAQLLVFIRFIHADRIIEQFLCCLELPMRTRGEDIFKTLDCFMKENNLQWLNCIGICTDGAPSMVGSNKGFTALTKKENENIIITHCFLHREALVAQSIGKELREVMDQVVQMVNYIKSRPLQSRLFAHIWKEMGAKFKNLILHTEVRWLSRGRVLCRIYELKEMMLKLFEENQQHKFCDLIQNKLWCRKLAYLADIFEHLNKVNSSMQGKGENILTAVDKICAMRDKIAIWKRKVTEGNFEMFSKTADCELKCEISLLIVDHLALLGEKVRHYFPNIEIQDYDWIRNPFLSTAMTDFSLIEEEEFAEIKNNRSLLMMHEEVPEYPNFLRDNVLLKVMDIRSKAVALLCNFPP
ncbi:zinc finger BED domain-containing protein 5-like [Rhinatrema bivittatum]|uniref:zinc finger BED domain-containing protein 5-like n=1 Tax=Rhinatrema bivittatum TaxID=194408 RepID=UPI0011298024|nr:zinc finger BED domain-containing protein 5-like [Rhinatrema bivittatum]